MKLANQLSTMPADNFLLSNFRAYLLNYLQVATVGLPQSTLAKAKRSAKTTESGLPKVSASTTQVDSGSNARRIVCFRYKKYGHGEKDC